MEHECQFKCNLEVTSTDRAHERNERMHREIYIKPVMWHPLHAYPCCFQSQFEAIVFQERGLHYPLDGEWGQHMPAGGVMGRKDRMWALEGMNDMDH